jgi:hypothetical protein
MQTLQDYAEDFAKYYELNGKTDVQNVKAYFETLGFEIDYNDSFKVINAVKKLQKSDLKKIKF